MKNRKGFTLIELMVVVLIVAILAAVAIPIMRGRIDAAKWSEGKAIMGTIGTALRAYQAEKGEGIGLGQGPEPGILDTSAAATNLGFTVGDLLGTYFASADFSITAYANPVGGPFTFTITGTNTNGAAPPNAPSTVTLTSLGIWTP